MGQHQVATVVSLPALFTLGPSRRSPKFLVDFDEDGGLIVKNEAGVIIFRIQDNGDVDAAGTFTNFGV